MVKNKLANLAIFSILLISLALTSAATENGFEIAVVGQGSTSDDRISGNAGDVVSFTVQFNNSNSTYPTVTLSLSGTDITSQQQTITGNDTLSVSFTIPSTQATQSRTLTGVVNASGTVVAIISDPVYYTVNSAPVSGCTDSAANNYNPLATVDDGSCTYTISEDTLCEIEGYTERGDLEISDYNIDNLGDGNDDEWQFLDSLEIEIEVENTGSENIEDVEVRIAIYDDKIENGGSDVTNDFNLEDEVLTGIGKLKDDDQESVTFVIEEVSTDLDDGTYYMYVMAYEDGNEDVNCRSEIDSGDFYYEFSIESVDYEDSIVVKGPEFDSEIDTQCEEQNLEIKVPVYNLGDEEEERVLVNLYSAELKIDEYVVIKNLNDGDKEVVSFFINVPSDLTKDKYSLDVILSFDWDSDEDDEDPNSYDEENSESAVRLNILGCTTVKAPTVSATLESATEVGSDLVVKTIIKNNGESTSFIVSPTGYESWADLVGVNPGSIEIASGETQEVMITLSPKQAGAKTFSIKILSNGEIYNQPVSVNIKEAPSVFSGLGLSNTMIYLIIAIVALLILIFIVLIVRAAQRP